MSKKYVLDNEKIKAMCKEIEAECRKDFEEKTKELKLRLANLREDHEELKEKYISVVQERDLLKAKITEMTRKAEEESKKTIEKYKNIFGDTNA